MYDGVSSNILLISKSIYDNHKVIFKNIENGSYMKDSNFEQEYQEVLSAVKDGLLQEINNTDLQYWFEKENLALNFKDEISHLMISVTEKCNLRCKYCVFSGHYPGERKHGNISIDRQTLDNCLSLFFKISKSHHKIINFYGGEPLLNFEAMKYVLDYTDLVDDSVMICATTNGTLLNKSICDWFIQHKNVHFYVSLAGIPKVHDQLRITVDGKESFSTIEHNLMYLKSKSPQSYSKRIHFIFNIFSEYQLLEINEYCQNNDLFKDMETQPEITFIDCENDDGYVYSISEKITQYYKTKYDFNLLDKYFDLLKAKEYDHLLVKHFDEEFLSIHRRPDITDNIITGVCKPFVKKMFVTAQGDINLCENFICNGFFGNVNSCVTMNRVKELLDTYKTARLQTCKQCWASKMCSLCFKDLIDENSAVNSKRATHLCENEKNYLLSTLRDYCYIMEKDNAILNHLDDYILNL